MMTFCDNMLKSFSENFKQLTKMNYFLLFLHFHENRRILPCFHHRYEFCMQKYRSKCIFIDYFCIFMKTVGFCPVFITDMNSACKNTVVSVYLLLISIEGYSLAISHKFKNFKFCFICLLFHLKILFDDF